MKVYEFLADGFEEVEALAPVDILRRGGVEILTVSVTGRKEVESAHHVTFLADLAFEEADLSDAAMLLLPGGLPGATNLNDHEGVRQALVSQIEAGRRVGAICAAPLVLGGLGLLRGKKATCYPGFEKYLDGADYTADLVTTDGLITTGKGPAAAFEYSYEILSFFKGQDTADSIRKGMMYSFLMDNK